MFSLYLWLCLSAIASNLDCSECQGCSFFQALINHNWGLYIIRSKPDYACEKIHDFNLIFSKLSLLSAIFVPLNAFLMKRSNKVDFPSRWCIYLHVLFSKKVIQTNINLVKIQYLTPTTSAIKTWCFSCQTR